MSSDFYGGQHYAAGPSVQSIIDAEHLRLLRIGYFISAGVTAFMIPLGLVYAVLGFLMPTFPRGSGSAPPDVMAWVFGILGTAITLFATLATVLKILTAIRLKQRRGRVLCLVTAGFCCFEIPYGLALGLMTFTVLNRPSVREEFARQA